MIFEKLSDYSLELIMEQQQDEWAGLVVEKKQ